MVVATITVKQIMEMRDFIAHTLDQCDNTHGMTTKWLLSHGLYTAENRQAISALGGCCCDCEVAMNTPETEQEIRDRLTKNGIHIASTPN